VNLIVAVTFLAAVGNIERFPDRRTLVAYLGLDPKVRQSGDAPATHGHISKQGSAPVRVALVEASWSAVGNPGPLRAFYQRIRARRGHQIAITATARKLACLFWVLLWRQQVYAFGQPSLTAKKLRRLQLTAGAPRCRVEATEQRPCRPNVPIFDDGCRFYVKSGVPVGRLQWIVTMCLARPPRHLDRPPPAPGRRTRPRPTSRTGQRRSD
jgi:hypothetical protein